MENKNWIEEWAQQYDKNEKLPKQKIPCSAEGCVNETTCFSSNLKNRVVAHAEGVRGLLRGFKCRSCRTESAVATKTTGTAEKPVRRAAKKTISKAALKQTRTEELTAQARNSTANVNAVPERFKFDNPDHVRQLTEGACMRPDIYLNNDRACDGCDLYEHCACAAKQLLSESGRKPKAVVAGPRRKK